jgi:hypothetical protein
MAEVQAPKDRQNATEAHFGPTSFGLTPGPVEACWDGRRAAHCDPREHRAVAHGLLTLQLLRAMSR